MYYIGVDIGQAYDYSAIAGLKVHQRFREKSSLPGTIQYEHEPQMIVSNYQLKILEQIPIGTKYQEIVRMLQKITEHIEIARAHYLIVDMTGVGRPVVEMMRDAGLAPIGVQITSGYAIGENDYGYNVPKKDIVATLLTIYQNGRIEEPEDNEFVPIFEEQLKSFHYKINPRGHETFQAERESIHDDLVLAVALAAWYAERSEAPETVGVYGKKKQERDDFDPLRGGLM